MVQSNVAFGFIYLICNKVNGKCYVGQSIDPLRRWRQHLKYSNYSSDIPLIDRAIKKHGRNNFEFKIMTEASSQEELNSFENELIDKLNTLHPQGYNLCKNVSGRRGGHTISEATRRKISETKSRQMRKLTDAQIKAVCEDDRSNVVVAAVHGVSYLIIRRIRASLRYSSITRDLTIKRPRLGERGRKLTEDQVKAILRDPRPGTVISAEYGISESCVSGIRHGTIYRVWLIRPGIEGCSSKPSRTSASFLECRGISPPGRPPVTCNL